MLTLVEIEQLFLIFRGRLEIEVGYANSDLVVTAPFTCTRVHVQMTLTSIPVNLYSFIVKYHSLDLKNCREDMLDVI